MKVLHIDSSVRQDRSVSKELSALFIEELKGVNERAEIDYLDLAEHTPEHPSALFIKGNYTIESERTPEMVAELVESEKLVDRMLAADAIVIGMPMYNFSVPSIFKAFIDNIVRINRTFKMVGNSVEGLLTNKKVVVINTRGVDFNNDNMDHMDQLRPYLKAIFGFIGITDLTFINVSPVQFSEAETREKAISKAKEEIRHIATNFIPNLAR
ncbi:FMN-dependent NADH-azoreductase [Mucilaginibacter sp. OK098]|uniref:FMN-dependent NADH-azoreductase n=1 Tax=Mucilaginibacter sp. OK098 TaxID=1855297 RepID=UPI0009344D64|nr:NAD(P)H-dependent oxidoreductase [Mucilaginibacter sp. OK098]